MKQLIGCLILGATAASANATLPDAKIFTYEGIIYETTYQAGKCETREGDYDSNTPGNPQAQGKIVIPQFVSDGEQEYEVTAIGSNSFTGTAVTEITLPSSIESISQRSFKNCWDLETVNLAGNSAYVHASAFEDCKNLTNIDLSKLNGRAAVSAFARCKKLENADLSNITSVGDNAFFACSNLTTLCFSSKLNAMENTPFGYDTNIRKVYYNAASPIQCAANTFPDEVYAEATLYVPETALEAFRATTPWNLFIHIEPHDFEASVDLPPTDASEPVYYDLNGRKAGDNATTLPKGLYLKVSPGKAEKVIIR